MDLNFLLKVKELLLQADSLAAKFKQESEIVYIDEAVVLSREALALFPPSGHPARSIALGRLAAYLLTRHEKVGGINDLNEAIKLDRAALVLCSPGSPIWWRTLSKLAVHLNTRFEQLGRVDDLDEAINLDRDALVLIPPGHADQSTAFHNLACHLFTRFNKLQKIDDLNEAIVLDRDALALCHLGHLGRSTHLMNLARHLSTRYKLIGIIDDLNEVIILCRDSLALLAPSHPDRSKALNNLEIQLSSRYKQLGGIDDLNEAVFLSRNAVALIPAGHPDRSTSLNNLASLLYTRYNQLGRIDDINEAIDLDRDALEICSSGHQSRLNSLIGLAAHLSARYNQLGKIHDLNEAIVLDQDALDLSPPGNPLRFIVSNNRSHHLSARYKQLGGINDIDEAIVLARDALRHCPQGHRGRPAALDNVASRLFTRYEQLRGIDDLNEAIILARNALLLRPSGNPDRFTSLLNLGKHLSTRYNQLKDIGDLNEAIVLDGDALALCPPGHPDRSTSLNNFAVHLSTRYTEQGDFNDIDTAIGLSRDALVLRPPGHPDRSMSLNNLASHLSNRFKQLRQISDINEAISLVRDTLALRPLGHPNRSTSLKHLTDHLLTRFTLLDDVQDREESFSLYAQLEHVSKYVSSNDLSAAKSWIYAAEHFHHPTTVLAHQTALSFLVQHFAVLPPLPHHLSVLKTLSSSLAADAFSACLRNNSLLKAVELLEQGRGVFWGQLTRLRSSLDEVIASGPAGEVLADRFRYLTSLVRNALHSPGAGQHDQVCCINSELQRVVSDIRDLPGLSRFLLPPLFSELQRAASGGPVIIVNVSQYSCDALVVFVDRDPVHIPLSITKVRVQELSSQLHALTRYAKSMDMTRDFAIFLRKLWDDVVSHIVSYLSTTCPYQSRIWWCPTASFSHLPLHAAGPFRKDGKNLSRLYISSYTPTLTALIRARRPSPTDSTSHMKNFIAIGEANATGTSKLASVSSELVNIGQQVDGLAMFTRIDGRDSSIPRVTNELGKNEWLHLACHGIPNPKQPFESAFALHDGLLTIQRIIQCDLKNAEFAYLSACHTTVGDEENPDEVIHLASAMQFAGFRSVIGTMWAVDDGHTNNVTSVFYKNILDESGRLDRTRAAFALRKTMGCVDMPFDQRILYIHLGA